MIRLHLNLLMDRFSEGVSRLPVSRFPRTAALLEHLVDLLETETLGFRNKEVGEQQAQSTTATPNEEDPSTEVSLVTGNRSANGVPYTRGTEKRDTYGSTM